MQMGAMQGSIERIRVSRHRHAVQVFFAQRGHVRRRKQASNRPCESCTGSTRALLRSCHLLKRSRTRCARAPAIVVSYVLHPSLHMHVYACLACEFAERAQLVHAPVHTCALRHYQWFNLVNPFPTKAAFLQNQRQALGGNYFQQSGWWHWVNVPETLCSRA